MPQPLAMIEVARPVGECFAALVYVGFEGMDLRVTGEIHSAEWFNPAQLKSLEPAYPIRDRATQVSSGLRLLRS